jgi:hypothetical protein
MSDIVGGSWAILFRFDGFLRFDGFFRFDGQLAGLAPVTAS